MWVGITGNWMGLPSKPLKPSFWTAVVGIYYVAAGISLLPKRRTGALLGIVFILLEVLGRVHLVRIGTYPSTGPDFVKSVFGGAIAILVVVYPDISPAYAGIQVARVAKARHVTPDQVRDLVL